MSILNKNLKKTLGVSLLSSLMLLPVFNAQASGMEDDPVLLTVMIDQFEVRDSNTTNPIVIEAEAWIGKDLDKIWFKIDNEQVGGHTEEQELQMLYSHAVDPYWDLQVGWRGDLRPDPSRNWLAFGIRGLAPYWFDVEAQVFLGNSGETAARLSVEYEIMFDQNIALVPEVVANFYGDNDDNYNQGSGLSDVTAGLRLLYHIRPEFAPYVGFNWNRKFSGTKDRFRASGLQTGTSQFVIGFSAWF